ncbi:hypothetical protein LQF76_11450 [Gloeomargaritales cyanobacterium VI4D9]|nr:hypothetical protein LQF76_11450 [Gloeomargaritales cyanobacterium VI4D9]
MKKSKSEVVQEQHLEYLYKIGNIPAEDIISVDETATQEGIERQVVQGLRGKKFIVIARYKGQKHTLIGAISVDGIVCYKIIKGSRFNKETEFFRICKNRIMPKIERKEGSHYGYSLLSSYGIQLNPSCCRSIMLSP